MGKEVLLPEILLQRGITLDKNVFRYRPDNLKVFWENGTEKYKNGFALDEIELFQIWHSSVKLLNDPFEIYAHANKNEGDNLTDEEFYKIWYEQSLRVNKPAVSLAPETGLRDFFNLNKDNIIATIKRVMNRGGYFKEFIDDVRTAICLSSFTNVCDSRLMWGYYCNGLSGICIIYNREKLKKSKIILEDVNYTPDGYQVDVYNMIFNYRGGYKSEVLMQIPRVKHLDWKHESEQRSLITFQGDVRESGIMASLEQSCVDGVIIGKNCHNETKLRLRRLAKKLRFKVFMADADLEHYQVKIYQ